MTDLRPVFSTYSVSFTEAPGDHVVHVSIFTQLELSEVDFHLTVFDEHAVLHHLKDTYTRQQHTTTRDKHHHTHTHTHDGFDCTANKIRLIWIINLSSSSVKRPCLSQWSCSESTCTVETAEVIRSFQTSLLLTLINIMFFLWVFPAQISKHS